MPAALDKAPHQLRPGEWTKHNGHWYACTPNGLLANLSAHNIVEHEDGLTVSPSILVTDGAAGHRWHGLLKHGVWEEG